MREKSWKVEEGGFLDESLHFTFAKGQPWALCSEVCQGWDRDLWPPCSQAPWAPAASRPAATQRGCRGISGRGTLLTLV